MSYDALNRPTALTDANGHTTATAYDAAGQVTTVTDPAGAVTTNTWNTVGDRITRADANGHVTAYSYDPLHRLTVTIDPLGHKVSYGYDPEGHATTATNARGATATTVFDPRGLPTATTYSDHTPTTSRAYDKAGHPTSITDATGTRTLGYDQADRLISVSPPGGGTGFAYAYDSVGNIMTRQYPDGEKYTSTYDADGHQTQQTADGASTAYAYDPAGNLISTTLPGTNGYTEARTYDPVGRLSSIASTKGATTLASWQLTRDAAGQPTTVSVNRLGTTSPQQTYTYDPDGRLTQATGSATTNYTYDPVGNRKTMVRGGQTTNYSYDQADELTLAATGLIRQNYTYDADGNATGNGSTASTVSYDFTNHPIAAVQAGVNYTFTNDAQGNRVTTSSGGTIVRTAVWDVNNTLPQLATETNATGAVIGDYGYDPLGLPQSQRTGGATSYDHHDWLGSITDQTDANGAQQSRMSYDAFGQQTTTALAPNPPTSPFGFAGQHNDPTLTGRQDDRARTYDPSTGRFTGRDPLAVPATAPYGSAYSYAADAPTLYTDPSGMTPQDDSDPQNMGVAGAIGSGLVKGTKLPFEFAGDLFNAFTGRGSGAGGFVDKYFPVRPAYAYYVAAAKLRDLGCNNVADLVEKHADELAQQVAVAGIGGLDSWASRTFGPRSELEPRVTTGLGADDGLVPAATDGPPPLRQAYIDEVEGLKRKAADMKAAGASDEEVARALHQARRNLGVKYKDLTPEPLREQIYARNMAKYGDKLGPTIDWLRVKGKSWEDIIESSTRTGGQDLGLGKKE